MTTYGPDIEQRLHHGDNCGLCGTARFLHKHSRMAERCPGFAPSLDGWVTITRSDLLYWGLDAARYASDTPADEIKEYEDALRKMGHEP